MMRRVHLFVSGTVQGVLYRRYAQAKAKELGITGWAHNLVDGRVELVAEGEEKNVEQFIEWCSHGSPLARVENVEVAHEDYKGEFSDFEVREFGF